MNPDKARYTVQNAVASGKLVRPSSCSKCGRPDTPGRDGSWGSDAAESVKGPFKQAMTGADARLKAFKILSDKALDLAKRLDSFRDIEKRERLLMERVEELQRKADRNEGVAQEALKQLQAAEQKLREPGYVRVPREPTAEMLAVMASVYDAGWAYPQPQKVEIDWAEKSYRAMLAAAPQSEAKEGE